MQVVPPLPDLTKPPPSSSTQTTSTPSAVAVEERKNSYVSSCSSDDYETEDEDDDENASIVCSSNNNHTNSEEKKDEKQESLISKEQQQSVPVPIVQDDISQGPSFLEAQVPKIEEKQSEYVSQLENRVSSLEQTIQSLILTLQQQQQQQQQQENHNHDMTSPSTPISTPLIVNYEKTDALDNLGDNDIQPPFPLTPRPLNNLQRVKSNLHIPLVDDSPSPTSNDKNVIILTSQNDTQPPTLPLEMSNVQLEYRSFTPDYEEELRSLRRNNSDDEADINDSTQEEEIVEPSNTKHQQTQHLEKIDTTHNQRMEISNLKNFDLRQINNKQRSHRRSQSFDMSAILTARNADKETNISWNPKNLSRDETLPPRFPTSTTKTNHESKIRKESIGAQSEISMISVETSDEKKDSQSITETLNESKSFKDSSVSGDKQRPLYLTPRSSYSDLSSCMKSSAIDKSQENANSTQPNKKTTPSNDINLHKDAQKLPSETAISRTSSHNSITQLRDSGATLVTNSTASKQSQSSETTSVTKPQPQGIISILKGLNLDSMQQDGSATEDVDENMEEFIKVPHKLEKLLFFGLAICVDAFLNIVTLFPIKFLWSTLCLICTITQPGKRNSVCRFHRRHFYQMIRALVILLVYHYFLAPVSIGKLYHWIRGQAMIKLYVIIAMVEVFDRLMCSLGQDAMDSLYWNTTRRPFHPRCLVSSIVVFVYAVLHSAILFIHIATLNVAMNSSDQALLSLLIGGSFAEIKSTVFKKFNKQNLFKITTSDICERFKLVLFLSLVLLLNISQGGMDDRMIKGYLKMCVIIMSSEMLCDWIKHMFITKFNFIKSSVYPDYTLILSGDITGYGHEGVNIDHTHAVVKRLGFSQIPLVCVMMRYLREALRYANTGWTDFSQPHYDPKRNFAKIHYFIDLIYIRWKFIGKGFLVFLFLLVFKILLSYAIHRASEHMLYGKPSGKKTTKGTVMSAAKEGPTKMMVCKSETNQQRRQAV